MNGTQNLNLNQCYKSYQGIGATHYINICDGTKTSVPWGIDMWLAAPLLLLVFVISLFPIVAILFGIFSKKEL